MKMRIAWVALATMIGLSLSCLFAARAQEKPTLAERQEKLNAIERLNVERRRTGQLNEIDWAVARRHYERISTQLLEVDLEWQLIVGGSGRLEQHEVERQAQAFDRKMFVLKNEMQKIRSRIAEIGNEQESK